MSKEFIYSESYYQKNYQNINILIENLQKCKIKDYKYLFLQKIYLNTNDSINWDSKKIIIRDTCYYLKLDLFHDKEWFHEIMINPSIKFTKENIEKEILNQVESLELKDKKFFVAPMLKLKNYCIYGIIIINENKEEINRMINDNNRKKILFSNINNMNDSNECYNIIKNINNTSINKELLQIKIPLPITGINNMNKQDNINNCLFINLSKLIDSISRYLPHFKIEKYKINNNTFINTFKNNKS